MHPAVISDDLARRIASEWYGGMASAMYSLASTGKIHDADGLRREINRDIAEAVPHEAARLRRLLAWVDYNTGMHTYCCRIQTEAFGTDRVFPADTIAQALSIFTEAVEDRDRYGSLDHCTLTMYHTGMEACECDSTMNFHDYPSVMYGVGKRGGIRREIV